MWIYYKLCKKYEANHKICFEIMICYIRLDTYSLQAKLHCLKAHHESVLTISNSPWFSTTSKITYTCSALRFLTQCLQTACWPPSAGNSHPFSFMTLFKSGFFSKSSKILSPPCWVTNALRALWFYSSLSPVPPSILIWVL